MYTRDTDGILYIIIIYKIITYLCKHDRVRIKDSYCTTRSYKDTPLHGESLLSFTLRTTNTTADCYFHTLLFKILSFNYTTPLCFRIPAMSTNSQRSTAMTKVSTR